MFISVRSHKAMDGRKPHGSLITSLKPRKPPLNATWSPKVDKNERQSAKRSKIPTAANNDVANTSKQIRENTWPKKQHNNTTLTSSVCSFFSMLSQALRWFSQGSLVIMSSQSSLCSSIKSSKSVPSRSLSTVTSLTQTPKRARSMDKP